MLLKMRTYFMYLLNDTGHFKEMKRKLWLAKGDVQAKNSDTVQPLSVTEIGEQCA